MHKRPAPPTNLGAFSAYPLNILPALDIPLWASNTFLGMNSKLYNKDHEHLRDALEGDMPKIGFLWAAGGYTKQMRRIIGLTEESTFRGNAWAKARHEQQMMEWFGFHIPDFIITLDGGYCAQCSDAEFCALVEHELYHIGQQRDEFDAPKFYRDTGLPMLGMRGHDVEEFIGVVRRYGATGATAELVKAASAKPEIAKVDIAHACGNCLKLAA